MTTQSNSQSSSMETIRYVINSNLNEIRIKIPQNFQGLSNHIIKVEKFKYTLFRDLQANNSMANAARINNDDDPLKNIPCIAMVIHETSGVFDRIPFIYDEEINPQSIELPNIVTVIPQVKKFSYFTKGGHMFVSRGEDQFTIPFKLNEDFYISFYPYSLTSTNYSSFLSFKNNYNFVFSIHGFK